MKTKLESSNPNFQKEKELAIEINQKCGGTIVINIEPNFDNHGTKKTEFYIDSVVNKLPYGIDVYISCNNSKKLLPEFSYLPNAEINDKSKEMINKVIAIYGKHNYEN